MIKVFKFVIFSAIFVAVANSTSFAQIPQNEENNSEEYVETMLFDLYLGDQLRGTIMLEYTEQWFEIPNPEDVIDQLPDLKEKSKVLELLTHRVFKELSVKDVGRISYDLDTFTVILNLKPEMLFGKALTVGQRLPEPEKKLALQQSFRLAVAGEVDESLDTAFNHRSNLSYGKSWLTADGTVISNSQYELSDLAANHIFEDFHIKTGLLYTQGQFLTSSNDFAGISVETSRDVYLNQELLRGSKIEIFVPSRAQVDFFRGERLLMSRVFDFGLQEVDTSSFPQGSYDVDIVIREDDGTITRESRFFTKSGLLSLRDKPIYSLQAGVTRDQLSVDGVPIFQAGLRWRLFDVAQIEGSVYGTDQVQVFATEMTSVWRNFIVDGGFLISNNSDSAVTASITADFEDISADFRITKTLSGFVSREIVEEETEEELLEEEEDLDLIDSILPTRIRANEFDDEDNNQIIGNKRLTIAGSLSKRFDFLTAQLLGSKNENAGIEERYAYGGRLTLDLLRSNRHYLRAQAAVFDTERGTDSSISLAYTLRFGNWSAGSTAYNAGTSDDNTKSLLNSVQYDNRDVNRRGTRAYVSDETQKRMRNGEDETNRINRVDLSHTSNLLHSEFSLRNRRKTEDTMTRISGELETSFNVTDEGRVTLSNPVQSQSIFIADVISDTTDSEVEVFVNDYAKAKVNAGSTAVVGLEPYKIYHFGIRPTENADLVTYDTDLKTAVVYPGNIVRYSFAVNKVFVALGYLVDEQGKPLSYQRIKGVVGHVYTEESGMFQAEISGTEKLYVEGRDYNCVIELPQFEKPEYYHDFGELVCKTVSETELKQFIDDS